MFTIRLLDADAREDRPLPGLRVRIAALDETGKPKQPPLADGYADLKGRIAFDVDVPRRAIGPAAPALPSVKLIVSGIDGGALLAKTFQLERDKTELVERVNMAEHGQRLAAPLDGWRRELAQAFSPALTAVLAQRKITSLADVRSAGEFERDPALSASDRAQIEKLRRHAHLQLLSRNHRVNQSLIDAGFPDLAAIAETPRAAFVKALTPGVGAKAAERLFASALEKAAILSHLTTAARVAHAAGVAGAHANAVAPGEAPPCACDCQSAVSPLPYLTDLLDYAVRHVTFQDNALGLSDLERHFGQPFGDLPADCEASTRLVRQVRLCIEVLLRKRPASGDAAVTEAHRLHAQAGYDALLRELGTSSRELRLARGATPAERQALADRLGVAGAQADTDARLDRLRLAPDGAGSRQLTEPALERLFGLQDTRRDPLSTSARIGDAAGQLVRWRFQGVEWNRSTDSSGRLHASLTKSGSQHQLRIYRAAARLAADLVATGDSTRAAGEIVLTAANGSGLHGRVTIAYTQDDRAIEFAPVPELLAWRLASLRNRWVALDAAAPATGLAYPVIDPDLISDAWVRSSPAGDVVFERLQERRAQLDALLAAAARIDTAAELDRMLTSTPLTDAAGRVLVHALGFSGAGELSAVAAALSAGTPLPVDPLRLGLTIPELTALIEARTLAASGQADAFDWAQIHHLLVRLEKRRHLFPVWRAEEAAQRIAISPDRFGMPTGSASVLPDLQVPGAADSPSDRARRHWRRDEGRLRAWTRTLDERLEQERVAVEGLRGAVDCAEEATLPALRDRLVQVIVPLLEPGIGPDLQERQNWVTNHLLVHASEGACRTTTRIAQAIETLQLLVHGSYVGLLEAAAFRVSHALDYGEAGFVDLFPGAWRWLGSYATWRAAMFVFLYPENLLLPTYRPQQSPLFRAFVEVVERPYVPDTSGDTSGGEGPADVVAEFARRLRGYFSLTANLEDLAHTLYYDGVRIERIYEYQRTSHRLTDAEYRYAMPIHLALTLQRQGRFEAALYWFRQVYDYAGRGLPGHVASVLPDQEGVPSFVRQEAWYDDALNPHTIAATRPGVDLRFVLLAIVRCLLDFAEAEFTADTAESLARARELYLTAERLLASAPLAFAVPDCAAVIGRLTIEIGDDRWRQVVIEIALDLLGGRFDDLPPFDTGKVSADLGDILGPRSRLSDADKRVKVRQLLEPHLRRPTSRTIRARQESGRAKRQAAWRRLGADGDVFAMLRQVEPASGPVRARLQVAPSVLPGRRVDRPIRAGQVIEVFIPAPDFEFCVPRNPILHVLGLRAAVGLFKLRHCLNVAGVAREVSPYVAPTDAGSGLFSLDAAGQLALPGGPRPPATPYRYKVLVERARQLVEIARQMESSFLGFMERRDQDAYSLLRARQDLEMARASVTLQDLRRTEAESQRELARLQRERVQAVGDHYQELLDAGLSANEAFALGFLIAGALIQNAVSIAGLAASGGASAAFSGLLGGAGTLGVGALPSAVVGGLLGAAGGALAGAVVTGGAGLVTASSVFSTLSSFERRAEEWAFQRDLAVEHEVPIAQQEERIADDRIDIAQQELEMARLGADHASDVVSFLTNKFTNAELFDWMSGVIGEVYRYFLEQATAVAKLAEAQLAFERQEAPAGIILGDYWTVRGDGFGAAPDDREPDRRGLTGSARLLQDVTRLDQQAFLTDRRKLQLTRTIALAALDPIAFHRFRETGVLPFVTPLELFDRDFPGHYLRLVKRVRVSVIALVPPATGIRATLAASGVSYVVRGPDVFERIPIVRPPDSVALSAPMNATGVFELQEQPELLLPFEGSGVETAWEFRLPRAANAFDYGTVAEVLVGLDYTALDSPVYRQQVVAALDPSISTMRAFSLRQQFADAWYDWHHPDLVDPASRMVARFTTRRADFQHNLDTLRIEHVTVHLAARTGASRAIEIPALRFTAEGAAATVGGAAAAVDGTVGTRQGNAAAWLPMVGMSPVGAWELAFPDTDAMRSRFTRGEVEDVLFVVTYGGQLPAWPA